MGTKLSPSDVELYRRTDEVLHYVWDPIGVSRHPAARDEYYGYLPKVFELLKQDASASEIEAHLEQISSGHMGLSDAQDRAKRAAELLLEWKARIDESN